MENQLHIRGRGHKTNGTSRGGAHYKNKHWVAGQGSKSRETTAGPADGERWERGGGPKRGRGRGRGSARSSPRPPAPAHQEEATSSASSEGQDAMEADLSDAALDVEVGDREAETPEERERIYHEVSLPLSR